MRRPPRVAIILAMLRNLLRTMRPKQWPKNAFIFAALIFDGQLFVIESLLTTAAGFLILCLTSSTVYILNDLADLETDRAHPVKRNRPLAAGKLSPLSAKVAAIVLFVISLAASFLLSPVFGGIVLLYFVINLFYSLSWKHIPILDVLLVAAGFVLRVAAGVSLITVERFSPWLYICMTLLALFIGFGKRRSEMILLAESAGSHRRVLDGYTVAFLDQLIVIVSGTTIVAYSLYTFSAPNLPSNNAMMLTIPFVLYGIFRYLHLIHVENAGGSPEELVFRDRPLLLTILLWGAASVVILYFGT